MIVGKEPSEVAKTPGVANNDASYEQMPDTGVVRAGCMIGGYRVRDVEPS